MNPQEVPRNYSPADSVDSDPNHKEAPIAPPLLSESRIILETIGAPAYSAYRPPLTLPALLFLLTLASTTMAGTFYYSGFLDAAGKGDLPEGILGSLISGLPYAFAIMGILLAHEMGHFLACRYYGLSATYPYFIPFPLLSIAGTMGAFIRIRTAFRNARELYDVGIAGPLLGYLFSLPALVLGLAASHLTSLGAETEGTMYFGEPLVFKIAAHLIFPNYSEAAETINLHPIGWAAWFGIFATSINLLPIGQLDGGHIVYALFGPLWHRRCSIAFCSGLVVLSALTWSPAYLVFGGLVFFLGLRHPHTVEGDRITDPRRKWLALLALLIFVLSFVPIPVYLK
jgi:membrane-associated protease RseP (regulator of RpoE activity)